MARREKKIAQRTKRTRAAEMIACPKCGMRVKVRGLLIHQRGSKCKVPTLAE
jgi:hypothetical protein